MERDERVQTALQAAGWRVAIVWECGLRSPFIDDTVHQLVTWLGTSSAHFESPVVRRGGAVSM